MYIKKVKETKDKFNERAIIAEKMGYTYLGRAVDMDSSLDQRWSDYGCYKKNSCEHINITSHKNFKNIRTDYCKKCTEEYYIKLTSDLGCDFICFNRPSKNGTIYLKVKLPCGHIKNIQSGNLKLENYRCEECLVNSYKEKCKEFGMEYLHSINKARHLVKLPCGCECDKHISNIKTGNWTCSKHKLSSLDFKSYIYLFKLTYNNISWLKIGYTSNCNERSFGFSDLPLEIELLYTIEIKTGRLAVKLEKGFHKANHMYKLDKDLLRQYMKSGFTECYDILYLDILYCKLQELNNIKEKYD